MNDTLKAIEIKHCQAASVTSRQDGSVKVSYVTPELRASECGFLLLLHGKNVCLSIVPEDVEGPELVKIDTERDSKTPSQRLRAILFLCWRNAGAEGTFDQYYGKRMDKICDFLKLELDKT